MSAKAARRLRRSRWQRRPCPFSSIREIGGNGLLLEGVSVDGTGYSNQGYLQSVAPGNQFHLLDQGKRRRRRGLESLHIRNQGSSALDSLPSQILQPLPAHVGIHGRGDSSENEEHQQ
jgi:hypothetical protein